ncbi:MAG: HPr kinase/phosphorylase [Vulcanimicrobiota bacterium]
MPAFFYKGFGLTFCSDLELPELHPIEAVDCDVVIERQPIEEELEPIDGHKLRYKVRNEEIYLGRPNLGLIRIAGGSILNYDPSQTCCRKQLRAVILGSGIAAILYQRGQLALHASCVVVDGQAILLAGNSGVGKSTLAAAFHQRGYAVIADDLLTLRPDGNRLLVEPSVVRLKLWSDSARALGISTSRLEVFSNGPRPRYLLPLPATDLSSKPVAALVTLGLSGDGSLGSERAEGARVANLLYRITFRHGFLRTPQVHQEHFQAVTQCAERLRSYLVWRPNTGWPPDRLVDYILHVMGKAS